MSARQQPVDAQGARDRLGEGSRTFGALLEGGPDAVVPTQHVVRWTCATSDSTPAAKVRPGSAPMAYLSLADKHALRGVLDRLLVVVNAAAMKMAAAFGPEVMRRPGYRSADRGGRRHECGARRLHAAERDRDRRSERAAGRVCGYLLSWRQIWAPRGGSASTVGLAWPPRDQFFFAEFADALVRSDRIDSILDRNTA